MTALHEMACEACHADSPPVGEQEQRELMQELPEWEIVNEEGVPKLRRSWKLKNFAEALAFTNRVGELAEEHNHHPAILTEWGGVTVTWWTHTIRGLHKTDFVMAAKTDQLSL